MVGNFSVLPEYQIVLIALFALISIALIVYAVFIEPRSPQVSNVNLKAPAKMRIVFLSDLHTRPENADYLAGVIDKVNALNPDIVIFGGDFTNGRFDEIGLLGFLSKLKGKKYAVLGNHDYGITYFSQKGGGNEALASAIVKKLNESGVRVFRNEYEVLEVNGTRVLIVGLDDCFAGKTAVPEQLPDADYRIFVLHEPECAGEWDYNLLLAGHTHGGQVALPLIGPPAKFLGRDTSSGLRGRRREDILRFAGSWFDCFRRR